MSGRRRVTLPTQASQRRELLSSWAPCFVIFLEPSRFQRIPVDEALLTTSLSLDLDCTHCRRIEATVEYHTADARSSSSPFGASKHRRRETNATLGVSTAITSNYRENPSTMNIQDTRNDRQEEEKAEGGATRGGCGLV